MFILRPSEYQDSYCTLYSRFSFVTQTVIRERIKEVEDIKTSSLMFISKTIAKKKKKEASKIVYVFFYLLIFFF